MVLKLTFSLGGDAESSTWLLRALSVITSCPGGLYQVGQALMKRAFVWVILWKDKNFNERLFESMTNSFTFHSHLGGALHNLPEVELKDIVIKPGKFITRPMDTASTQESGT